MPSTSTKRKAQSVVRRQSVLKAQTVETTRQVIHLRQTCRVLCCSNSNTVCDREQRRLKCRSCYPACEHWTSLWDMSCCTVR
eukprot:1572959-Amphidinium_carterae.1